MGVAPREVQDSRDIYGGDIYNKGAWFMHTLRWVVGDELFFKALRREAPEGSEGRARRAPLPLIFSS